MFNLNQDVVIHGVGSGLLQTVSGKAVEVLKGQNFKADISATLVDVEGGDSLFPIYTFISKKEGTVEVDSATFSLAQLPIMQTADITTTNVLKNNRFIVSKTATTLPGTLTGVVVISVISHVDGSVLPSTQTGTVAPTGGVLIGADGKLTWDTTVPDGEYAVWCQTPATNAASAGFLKNAMPEVCSVNWMIPVVEDTDGNKYQFDFYSRRIRADGKFSIDTSAGKAAVPKLGFKILDPGDGQDNFAVVTLSKLA